MFYFDFLKFYQIKLNLFLATFYTKTIKFFKITNKFIPN